MRFATRKQGQGMARRTWVCVACNAGHRERPKRCAWCGVPDMHLFDSTKELRRYGELLLMARAKAITDLAVHPRFPLCVQGGGDGSFVEIGAYEADFSYRERERFVVEDVKAKDPRAIDPLFAWKRKHFEAQYGVELRIVT